MPHEIIDNAQSKMQGTEITAYLWIIQMHYYSVIGTKNYNKTEDFNEPISITPSENKT
jgi:predicted ribosome quality control (RQC) complex YloA/Tae2 family protein